MMKSLITISLDVELIEKLRVQGSISETISELLYGYFKDKTKEIMTIEEKKQYLKKQIAIKKAEESLEKIKNGN